jgi:uncharacterized membrane protein
MSSSGEQMESEMSLRLQRARSIGFWNLMSVIFLAIGILGIPIGILVPWGLGGDAGLYIGLFLLVLGVLLHFLTRYIAEHKAERHIRHLNRWRRPK